MLWAPVLLEAQGDASGSTCPAHRCKCWTHTCSQQQKGKMGEPGVTVHCTWQQLCPLPPDTSGAQNTTAGCDCEVRVAMETMVLIHPAHTCPRGRRHAHAAARNGGAELPRMCSYEQRSPCACSSRPQTAQTVCSLPLQVVAVGHLSLIEVELCQQFVQSRCW